MTAAQPVKIEDLDESFLKQAEDIAFEFINLSTKLKKASALTPLKAPVYPRKTAGEPGLLCAAEDEVSQAEPELLLPASLPRLRSEGHQQQQATTQAQATGEHQQAAALQQVAGGQQLPSSRLVSVIHVTSFRLFQSKSCGLPKIIRNHLYIGKFWLLSLTNIIILLK